MKDEPIGQEDRNRINRLLEKSWTPKVFRHTTATEYSPILSTPDANQWFGWTENSNTSSFYRHYNGDEASKSLMEAFGIVPKQRALPKMKECPNVTCKELNAPDALFCVKCRIPLTVVAHIEEGHRKDQEIHELKDQMSHMMQTFESYYGLAKKRMNQMDNSIKFLTGEIMKYQGQFGTRPLTEKERRAIDKFKEQIMNIPNSDSEIEG